MLLQELAAYAELDRDAPPSGYQKKAVKYVVRLDASGNLLGIISTSLGGKDKGLIVEVPHLKRANVIRPILYADTGTYTFGRARAQDRPERIAQAHRSYVELADEFAAITEDPGARAVATYLHMLPGNPPDLGEDFDESALITFEVAGKRIPDVPAIRRYWGQRFGAEESGEQTDNKTKYHCIVCGQLKPAVARHPLKIKGIRTGQSSGTDLISANNDAFFSYGLENSLIAPTCASCAEKYANGLNRLLREDESHVHIAGIEYCFWARDGIETDITQDVMAPNPERVKKLLGALWSGDEEGIFLDTTPFFGLALKGNGSRAVVVNWIDTTLGKAKRHQAEFFAAQSIVDSYGQIGKAYGVPALANAMVPRTVRNATPPSATVGALVQFSLTGGQLPMELLNHAVLRCRAELGVDHDRAALIKLVLETRRRAKDEGGLTAMLDPDNREKAYIYGRILAVLDEIQYAALGSVNSSVIDRFYPAASATPKSVFGMLVRNAQNHIRKIDRDGKKGTAYTLDRRLEELQNLLPGADGWEKTLGLEGQSVFALGFYHERAHSRAQRLKYRQSEDQETAVDSAEE